MADETDPLLDGYIPVEAYRLTDDDASSRRIRDTPFGKFPKALTVSLHEVRAPDTLVGASSQACSVVFYNNGTEPVDITEIVTVGDFVASFDPKTGIMPGDKLVIAVTFTPVRQGFTTGGIYVDAAGAAGEKFVKLTGVGYTL